MYYEFYLDLYFLENLLMNYLVLTLAEQSLRNGVSVKRRMAAAAAGAAFACLTIAAPIHTQPVFYVLCNVLSCMLLAAAAFAGRPAAGLCLPAVLASALGLGSTWLFLRGVCRLPFWTAIPAGYAIVRAAWRLWRNQRNNTQFIYDVTLERKERSICVKGFLDSGNHLYMPVNRRPVHILEYDEAVKLLNRRECIRLQELMKLESNTDTEGNMFLLPYHTIGNNTGLLPVIEIDSIRIKHGESVRSTKGALAAVTVETGGGKGAYQMILHPEILDEWRNV